jgi:arylsulfatase A-like enzyme
MIARWPGHLPAGVVTDAMAMNIDFFPTLLALAGVPLSNDRIIDGRDLTPVWTEGASSPHELLFYYPPIGEEADAVRDARFKYLRSTGDEGRDRPHLSDVTDEAEAHDLHHRYPQAARRLSEALYSMRREVAANPRGWR